MKETTLCFLIDDEKVCLAMKKRGFGIGKWNGVGGKLESGESPSQAIVRETYEEIGVKIDENIIEKFAQIDFFFLDNSDWNQTVHVFLARNWEGQLIETEEMRPEWYSKNNLPFKNMWIDDPYWLPMVLNGEKIKGEFYFDQKGEVLTKFIVDKI